MARTTLNIAGGYYKDESYAISNRECVNFYPHIPEGQTITDGCLIGIGGIEARFEAEVDQPNRGSHLFGNQPYFVNGENLYRVTETYNDPPGEYTVTFDDVSGAESITLPGAIKRVIMADNGSQLCITVPGFGGQFNTWIYDGSTLTQISDSDFDGPAQSVCYSDGYFIFAKQNSNKWFISDLRDGTSYIATDFGSAESDPDDIVTIKPLRGIVFVFGSQTFEQYQNLPSSSGFPYERINSGTYNIGCSAQFSVVEANNALYWIGSAENEESSVWATNGGQPQKISTPSIDLLINQESVLLTTYAMKWGEGGHTFISFTLPGVTTIVYDTTTGLWHERRSVDASLDDIPWRPASIVYANSPSLGKNVLYVGDSIGENIGIYGKEYFDEYDEEIRGYFTLPSFDNGGRPFSVNAVELVMQTGDVPITGQGSDPVIRMSVSKSGGKTYSPEISRKIGQIGDYTKRIAWSPLGRFPRSCTLRFDISEPIKRVIVKAEVEIGR